MLLIINKILRLQIYFIVVIDFVKTYISSNKNITGIRIVYALLIYVFIANINTLIISVIELVPFFLKYIYANQAFKNAKITKIRLFTFEIFVYS